MRVRILLLPRVRIQRLTHLSIHAQWMCQVTNFLSDRNTFPELVSMFPPKMWFPLQIFLVHTRYRGPIWRRRRKQCNLKRHTLFEQSLALLWSSVTYEHEPSTWSLWRRFCFSVSFIARTALLNSLNLKINASCSITVSRLPVCIWN